MLLALSRPPFDLGPLACVALVPLFVAWRGRRPRGAAGLAFVAGVVYYAIVCSWIWYFGAVAIVPFGAAVAAYWAAAGALDRVAAHARASRARGSPPRSGSCADARRRPLAVRRLLVG